MWDQLHLSSPCDSVLSLVFTSAIQNQFSVNHANNQQMLKDAQRKSPIKQQQYRIQNNAGFPTQSVNFLMGVNLVGR